MNNEKWYLQEIETETPYKIYDIVTNEGYLVAQRLAYNEGTHIVRIHNKWLESLPMDLDNLQ